MNTNHSLAEDVLFNGIIGLFALLIIGFAVGQFFQGKQAEQDYKHNQATNMILSGGVK